EPSSTTGAEAGEAASGDSDRRRRRRGRRGGRRNRRDREGFAPEAAAAPEFAHDTGDAEPAPVGDYEAPSLHVPITASRRSTEPQPEAQSQEPYPAHRDAPDVSERTVAEPAVSESPRRRSTVREPAPLAASDEASAAAPSYQAPVSSSQPVVSSPAASDAGDRPPRSGWWSRRVLGKE